MKKKKLCAILASICVVIALFSGWKIYTITAEYQVGEEIYDDLEEYVALDQEDAEGFTESTETGEKSGMPHIAFEELQQINSDIVAWIYCEGTPINYPVVQTTNNTYYLKHLFNRRYNSSGCIFMDCRNSSDFSNLHTIIYGHHMKNSSMFSSITKYKKQKYYEAHPQLLLMTPDQNYQIDLLAGYVANVDDDAWRLTFDSENDFSSWVEQAIDQSTFESKTLYEPGERIVTLSTCSYEFDDARYVLLGMLTPCQ